jgi:hypothetical protein
MSPVEKKPFRPVPGAPKIQCGAHWIKDSLQAILAYLQPRVIVVLEKSSEAVHKKLEVLILGELRPVTLICPQIFP